MASVIDLAAPGGAVQPQPQPQPATPGGAVFYCSTCKNPRSFNHPSWRTKKGTDTFCKFCHAVTFHKNPAVEAKPPPQPQPSHPQPPAPPGTAASPALHPTSQPLSNPLPAGTPSATPLGAGPPAPPPPAVPPLTIDQLWDDFVQRLSQRNVSPGDMAGASSATVLDVLKELGYDPLSSARLQTEFQHRVPQGRPSAQPTAPSNVPSASPSPDGNVPHGSTGSRPATPAPGTSPSPSPSPAPGGATPSSVPAPVAAPVPQTELVDLSTSVTGLLPDIADGTTSVSGLDEDSLMKRAQKTMEEEIKKMDEEVKLLRSQLEAAEKAGGKAPEGKEGKKGKDDKEDKKEDKKEAKAPEPPPGVPYPELATKVPETLWPALVERLAACGLSEGDVEACSPLTFEKVLLYLAFNPLERAKLLQEFQTKYGAGAVASGPQPPKPDEPPQPQKPPIALEDPPEEVEHEATPLEIGGPPTGATLPAVGGAYEVGTNLKGEPDLIDPSALHRWPQWKGPGWPSAASAQPPSESGFGEFEAVLKCSVHHDRDIEFWCVSCESLVCSHCHISGFHKDHPFMPLAEAARRELPGIADWQMRAAQVSSKLQDHRVALDEVHQDIDLTHQQQIDHIEDVVEQFKLQLDEHKHQLIQRIRGHAAAQHDLFHAPEGRIGGIRNTITDCLQRMEVFLGAKPDAMSPDEQRIWAQGIMKVRANIGGTFNGAIQNPITLPNYSFLKFNNELSSELLDRLFLTKIPAVVPFASILDMKDLQHPLYTYSDRVRFTFAQPEGTVELPDGGTSAPIALHNNQCTATYAGTGSGHVLVKGTATFEAGKHYWEVRIDAMHNDNRLGTHVIVGLVAEGEQSMAATTGLAWCVEKVSGMVPMAVDCPPWTTGTLVGIFLDLDLNRVGLYCNKQCIAHLAIPHAKYTPAASIHCSHDQITLLPLADIPQGVALTSGLAIPNTAYPLTVPQSASSGLINARVQPNAPHDSAGNKEIALLQEECLRLQEAVREAKRDIAEQHRVQAQQKFTEQQIQDLKQRIDEAATAMAKENQDFQLRAAADLHKLHEFQQQQLEAETKRAWQMQVETKHRTNEVHAAGERMQDQSNRLERFLTEQQVLITQQMLERQRKQHLPHPGNPAGYGMGSIAGSPLRDLPPGVSPTPVRVPEDRNYANLFVPKDGFLQQQHLQAPHPAGPTPSVSPLRGLQQYPRSASSSARLGYPSHDFPHQAGRLT